MNYSKNNAHSSGNERVVCKHPAELSMIRLFTFNV